jgi:methyl-accepting chemotaxis protein
MRFLDNLRIGRRIGLAFLLPIFGLLAFSGYVIFERWVVVHQTSGLIHMASLAANVSAVVHELQKERGASSLFVASGGKQFGDKVAAQRTASDAPIQRLEAAFAGAGAADPAFAAALREAGNALAARRQLIQSIDASTIDRNGVFQGYTGMITAQLALVGQLALSTPDKSTADMVSAYLSFMEAKERAGQERATGSAGFAATFEPVLYRRFVSLITQQETYFALFARQAPPALVELLRDKMKDPAVGQVLAMRDAGHAKAMSGGEGVPAAQWFEASTRRIDLMKEVEDRIAVELMAAAQHVSDQARLLLLLQVAAVVVGLGATFAVALVLARGLADPIRRLTTAMNRLAQGDSGIVLEGIDLPNEQGEMARAVEVFRKAHIEAERVAQVQHAEDQAKERRRNEIERLTAGFQREVSQALGAVGGATQQLELTARALDGSAKRMAEHSTAVSAAASQTSANVQTVASAAEELAASITEIGRQVATSATVSQDAVAEADRTNRLVAGLADAAGKIGEVVTLIGDIAGQTNLLALNATIEAARAGDAGKGFAVVAGEVKSLATQTARATGQIATQVGAVQQATEQAVAAIVGIGRTISRINEIAAAIAAAVEEQDATTRDIARNAQEAARGTREVSDHVSDVTTEANETGRSADQLLHAASDLSGQSTSLDGAIQRFLAGVATA